MFEIIVWIAGALILGAIGAAYTVSKKKGRGTKLDNQEISNISILRALKKVCLFKGIKVVLDVKLKGDRGDVFIDAVMIGRFGVVAVEARHYDNQVYVHQNDKNWVNISGSKKSYFENLYKKGAVQKNALRSLFAKNSIYNLEIGQLCIFDGNKLELYSPKDLPAVRLDKLKKELKKPFYKRETPIDVDKVYSLLKGFGQS